MPGMPKRKKMRADIQAAGGVGVAVLDRLRNGESLNKIAASFNVGRSVLWRYLKKDPDRHTKYQQALKDGAAGMVDSGRELLEAASDYAKTAANSAHVQAVRNEAQYLQWHAGVTDRATFGPPDKTPTVTVSIEHLHLGSLQAQGAPAELAHAEDVMCSGGPWINGGDDEHGPVDLCSSCGQGRELHPVQKEPPPRVIALSGPRA